MGCLSYQTNLNLYYISAAGEAERDRGSGRAGGVALLTEDMGLEGRGVIDVQDSPSNGLQLVSTMNSTIAQVPMDSTKVCRWERWVKVRTPGVWPSQDRGFATHQDSGHRGGRQCQISMHGNDD